MYTTQSLLDIHKRTHRIFRKLIIHCNNFNLEDLNREMVGFGYPTIRLQLYHMIGAEEYWIGVLKGDFDADDHEVDYPDTASLEEYRRDVAQITKNFLETSSADELNTSRLMLTWQNKERMLTPAHVIMRTQTHIFQHQGQILAMCRLLGKPASGLDFPITE